MNFEPEEEERIEKLELEAGEERSLKLGVRNQMSQVELIEES